MNHAQLECGINYLGACTYLEYRSGPAGFRPVVCLKSEVALEKQEDGTYHIVDTVKTGKITFGEPVWEGDNASVTVSTNTNFQIEYQINTVAEGSWTSIENGGTITGLRSGNTVYARLTDGINHGDYSSLTLRNTSSDTHYAITIDSDENYGQVSVVPSRAKAGETVEITISPDEGMN